MRIVMIGCAPVFGVYPVKRMVLYNILTKHSINVEESGFEEALFRFNCHRHTPCVGGSICFGKKFYHK